MRKYLRRLLSEFQGRKASESEFLRAAVLSISVSGFGKWGIFPSHLNAFEDILCMFEDWRQSTLNTEPSFQILNSCVGNREKRSGSSLFVEFEAKPS